MGKCKYCGQKAGFLSKKHNECEKKHEQGKVEIIELIENSIIENQDFINLKTEVEKLAIESFIEPDEIKFQYITGFENAVEKIIDDGILSKSKEELIGKFIEQLNIPQDLLDTNDKFHLVIKAAILRDLTEGNIPESKIRIQGNLPFNFQKNEKLVWLFQDVEFYEQKSKTHYQGGYSGMSFKVAKGVYYRFGGFKGHPVSVEEMKYVDTGIMCLTNKHVYFASSSKNLRIQISKIITMNPYEDGIVLQKDGVTAKPQTFKNIDGWFIYNAISNLNQ